MRQDVFNFKITKELETIGQYDMPKISAFSPGKIENNIKTISFNYALTELEPENKICHFYLDDYQFERIWRRPDLYIPILKKFKAVIGPDFSVFSNLPKIQQIYNCWRNKVLMAYWQKCGINVIPNVQWSDIESFKWCFDGLEAGGIVAISTNGCHSKKSSEAFFLGYKAMCDALNPKKILCVGVLHKKLQHDQKIIKIDSFMEKRRKIWAEEEANSMKE